MSKQQPNIATVKLAIGEWRAVLVDYMNARATKREATAEASRADSVVKALRARLSTAMNGSLVAVCGGAVLTVKNTKGAEATITLKDGTKVDWSKVSGLTIGNKYVAAEDVSTIYGGRSGSYDIDCAGTP